MPLLQVVIARLHNAGKDLMILAYKSSKQPGMPSMRGIWL